MTHGYLTTTNNVGLADTTTSKNSIHGSVIAKRATDMANTRIITKGVARDMQRGIEDKEQEE